MIGLKSYIILIFRLVNLFCVNTVQLLNINYLVFFILNININIIFVKISLNIFIYNTVDPAFWLMRFHSMVSSIFIRKMVFIY